MDGCTRSSLHSKRLTTTMKSFPPFLLGYHDTNIKVLSIQVHTAVVVGRWCVLFVVAIWYRTDTMNARVLPEVQDWEAVCTTIRDLQRYVLCTAYAGYGIIKRTGTRNQSTGAKKRTQTKNIILQNHHITTATSSIIPVRCYHTG